MDGTFYKVTLTIGIMKDYKKNKTPADRKIVESDGGVAITNTGMEHSRSYMSGFDKIVIAVLLAVGFFYIISSIIQITYVFTDEFDSLIFIREATQIFAGAVLIFGAIKFIKKNTYLERIVDQMFEEIIYDRFEPVLRDIAEVQVGYDGVSSQIKSLNYSINDLKKSIEFAPASGTYQAQDHSASASLRRVYNLFMYVVLLNITLAVYMFMIYYPLWYIPYMAPLLFVMWWVVITYEYNQWDNSSAWMWVFAPILILPIYTMVFGSLALPSQMFAIMYLVLGLYAVSYYTWSMYNASGTLPFGLHKKLEDIANYEPEIDEHNNGEDDDMPRNGGVYRNSGEDDDMPRNGGLYRNSGEDDNMPRNGGLYRNVGAGTEVGVTPHNHQNMNGFSDRLLLIQEEFKLLNEEMAMHGATYRPSIPQNVVDNVKKPLFNLKLVKGMYKRLVSKSSRKTKNNNN